MKKLQPVNLLFALAFAVLLGLSGCGGGGSSTAAPPDEDDPASDEDGGILYLYSRATESGAILDWSEDGFSDFDLCVAAEPIEAFNDCTAYSGGLLRSVNTGPETISGLAENQVYWFQLRARSSSGTAVHSNLAKVLVPGSFGYGEAVIASHAVPAGAGSVEIPSLGVELFFPEGGTGTVTVTPLESAPIIYGYDMQPGEGFAIEMDDTDVPLQIILSGSVGEHGETAPDVFYYGVVQGVVDDFIGYAPRWVAMPYEDLGDGKIAYQAPAQEMTATTASFATAQNSGARLPRHYWISRIADRDDEVMRRVDIRSAVLRYIDDFIDEIVDAPLRNQVEALRTARPVSIHYGGDWYRGFTNLTSWITIFRPKIGIRSTLEHQSLAHETAHYLTHLLVGHDVQDSLEKTGSSYWGSAHGIRDEIGRANLLEDYAYYLESFLTGTGGNYILEEPHTTFRGLYPNIKDFPGLEGFAGSMLALLHVQSAQIRDYGGYERGITPLGLSRGEVFAAIAAGHTTVDTLRQEIESRLPTLDQRRAFQILLNRLGWTYHGRVRLVDGEGEPVVGAGVDNIINIGGNEYRANPSTFTSHADGNAMVLGVFGGESLLRVTLATTDGDQEFVFPVEIDWATPTNDNVELGEFVVQVDEVLPEVCSAPTTPSSDFQITGDGSTVRHLGTGLEWQRCPEGTAWDPEHRQTYIYRDLDADDGIDDDREYVQTVGGCVDSASRTSWDQAVSRVPARWRMPTIAELESIVEPTARCAATFHTFNPIVFPVFNGNDRYWSSTPGINPVTGETVDDAVQVLNPVYGVVEDYRPKSYSGIVRYVRD